MLLFRLERSPALSFIYHCSQLNKIGSIGEWEEESQRDERGFYLNQQPTLKSCTELVFSHSYLTRVIRVNTFETWWAGGEICLDVFRLEVQGFKDSCELNEPGMTWRGKHGKKQYDSYWLCYQGAFALLTSSTLHSLIYLNPCSEIWDIPFISWLTWPINRVLNTLHTHRNQWQRYSKQKCSGLAKLLGDAENKGRIICRRIKTYTCLTSDQKHLVTFLICVCISILCVLYICVCVGGCIYLGMLSG